MSSTNDQGGSIRDDLIPNPYAHPDISMNQREKFAEDAVSLLIGDDYTSAKRGIADAGITDPIEKLHFMFEDGVRFGSVYAHDSFYDELVELDVRLRESFAVLNDIALEGGDGAPQAILARNRIAEHYNRRYSEQNDHWQHMAVHICGLQEDARKVIRERTVDEEVLLAWSIQHITAYTVVWSGYVLSRIQGVIVEEKTMAAYMRYVSDNQDTIIHNGKNVIQEKAIELSSDTDTFRAWLFDYIRGLAQAAHDRAEKYIQPLLPMLSDSSVDAVKGEVDAVMARILRGGKS